MNPRKQSKYQLCDRHAPWFAGETRYRQLECMVEGGPGGWTPGCSGGKCRLWPGLDVFEPSVCNDELILEWTYANTPAERLEYLRTQLDAQCISYGELAELQGLAEHIEPGDVQLLEAAGVPEAHAYLSSEQRTLLVVTAEAVGRGILTQQHRETLDDWIIDQ